jgi:trimeric autotransporter adhesin
VHPVSESHELKADAAFPLRRRRDPGMRSRELACLLACLVAFGQTVSLLAAGHSGRVTLAGRAVPGAVVTVSQGERRFTTTTDVQGNYQLPDLPDGAWTVRVEMRGFTPVTRDITVAPDATAATWELTMLPAAEIAKDTVAAPTLPPAATAPPPGRPTTPPTDSQRSATAPRTPAAATSVTPNAGAPRPPAAANAGAAPPPPEEPRQADPSTGAADGFMIAGSVNNGASTPFALTQRFGNAVLQGRPRYFTTVTFSGNSSALNATPYTIAATRNKPDVNSLNVTANLQGPLRIPGLIRNGPTFQASFSRTASDNASSLFGRMPTIQERAGNFGDSPTPVVDPLTGLPFPDNQIPADRISPQAAALLNYYPLPNADPQANVNYQAADARIARGYGFTFSTGRSINPRNQINGTTTYNRSTNTSSSLFRFRQSSESSNIGVSGTWNRRINPFFTLRVTHAFAHSSSEVTPNFANLLNVSGDAGITGNAQDPRNWGPPMLTFAGGITSLYDANYQSTDTTSNTTTADATLTRGRHNYTFGGQVRLNMLDSYAQENGRGTFFFSGAASGSALADYLLGLPQSSSVSFGNPDQGYNAWSFAAYVMDDLRLRPNLTLNLGLRWEYEPPIAEVLDRMVNLDVAPDFLAVSPVLASDPVGALTGRVYPDTLVERDILGFQPRLSMAWRPILGSSLLVRAGYDRTRSSAVAQRLANLMAQQPPLATTGNAISTPADPLHLSDGFAASPDIVQNTFAVDPDFRIAYAQNWQVYLQRDAPASLTVAASYIGTHGDRLVQQFLPNTVAPGGVNLCPTCPSGFRYVTSKGTSRRHAGRFEVRRRTRNGLTASAQYTLSKATDNSNGFGDVSGFTTAQNWLDLNAEEGPSSFDQRHLFGTQVTYNTGVGLRGGGFLNGWKGRVVRNWTIDVRMTTGSGLPLTPLYRQGTNVEAPTRAALTGVSAGDLPGGYYLNPAAYAAPAAGSFGNAGRNSGRGPQTFTLDGSLQRGFPVNPRLNMDVRIDATNLLNRVVFTGVEQNIFNPQFGLPTQAGSMRRINARVSLRF